MIRLWWKKSEREEESVSERAKELREQADKLRAEIGEEIVRAKLEMQGKLGKRDG